MLNHYSASTLPANISLDLINSILDLSKIEAGKTELVLEEFYIKSLIDEIQLLSEPLVAKKANHFMIEFDDASLTTMHSDLIKIKQILINLISNACKFTENGEIKLLVKQENNFIIFNVSDTGIGMLPEQLEKIFQPFIQADASTTRKYGGTGLGLSIVKKLSELLNGVVEVSSEFEKGTQFTIKLPLTIKPALEKTFFTGLTTIKTIRIFMVLS